MIANYHTHTWRCHHASGTEREYVESAITSGIEILGFSDHTPYFFPGDYCSHFRMLPQQLEDYVQTVVGLRQEFKDQIQIHVGLEVEYYPDLFPQLLEFLRQQPVEYMLLGQHVLGNEIGEHYSGRQTDDETLLERYCRQTMDGMNTGLFTYLAHPDLCYYTGDARIYRKHMRQLCREAKSCNMPLEINLLGLAEGRNYPGERFFEIAAEEGCCVILGRDAHDAQAFCMDEAERQARDMVERLGLTLLQTVPLRPIG